MDAKNKKDFDQWLQAKYTELFQTFVDTDSLHDAYIIVTGLKNVEPHRYKASIQRAYILRRRQLIHYICTFIFPDPLFWLYQAMEEYDELEEHQTQTLLEQEEKRRQTALRSFAKWVHKNYSPSQYQIFRLFHYDKLDIKDIAKLTGLSKSTIINIISNINEEYKLRKNNE